MGGAEAGASFTLRCPFVSTVPVITAEKVNCSGLGLPYRP